jgi:uncharacterized protein with von Willebrand factor type A (vWA) domain
LPETTPSGHLLSNLLLFGRVLSGVGLDGSPGRMIDLVTALGHVDLGRKRDVYHVMRALVVRRREDIPAFDDAFQTFWRKPSEGFTTLDLRAMGERRRFRRPRFDPAPLRDPGAPGDAEGRPAEDEPPALRARLTYSATEVLRHKDFALMTGEELDEVRRLLDRFAWRPAARRTRRYTGGEGKRLDLRRSIRTSLRHGGEVLRWSRRRPRTKPRPLVVLADISGSMERYTRLLLLFLYSLAEGLEQRVEAFVFGTRLTRVTRQLRGRDVDRALAEVSRAVADWSGGTRIGEALRAFNFDWGRRAARSGSVVLLISDGWDRGEPDLLHHEMARLQRSCHRLVWLNPLLGEREYEPLARGMRTALPFVDDFLPVHDLASLEDLARRLSLLDAHRPARRQSPRLPP